MFYLRLSALCNSAGLNVTNFAVAELGVSNATPSNWKKGVSPKASVVEKTARFFNVSADYLLGLSDDPSPLSGNLRELGEKEARLVDTLRKAEPAVRETVYRMAEAALSANITDAALVGSADEKLRPRPGNNSVRKNIDSTRMKCSENDCDKLPSDMVQIRVEGDAAAGNPITAVPYNEDVLAVVSKKERKDGFVVKAVGDSMIGAGIENGDFCLFLRDSYRDNGKIMFVSIESDTDQPDVAIKHVFLKGSTVELRSDNPAYKPMVYPASKVTINGVFERVVEFYNPD